MSKSSGAGPSAVNYCVRCKKNVANSRWTAHLTMHRKRAIANRHKVKR